MSQPISKLYLRDVSFVELMRHRIFNILLVANPYDAFMLEDDGRIDEKIFNEYTQLGLTYPPHFHVVSTLEEAHEHISRMKFELVIAMPASDSSDAFDIARDVKRVHPEIPIVVLTPFSHGIAERMEHEDLTLFDYVFCWLGDTYLLLSIIKLIEDKMNLEHDISTAGVQMILLVEDSIRFYSAMLPDLYQFVLKQSMDFATEALNAHQAKLRQRGRPKIVLARSYDEARALYDKYHNNTLGVITDCRMPIDGRKDAEAGLRLIEYVRTIDRFVPCILQSAEDENHSKADALHVPFVSKNSKKRAVDLRGIVEAYFGFGDFVFRDPNTMCEVARIHNLKDLQDQIFTLPAESFLWHIRHNNVSRWLCSRALFPISEYVKSLSWEENKDLDAHRQMIFDAIVQYRRMKNRGIVAEFQRDRYDRYSNFARIGDGSLGGKGRGLAFLDNIITRHPEFQEQEGAHTTLPKTLVLCTDVFDRFMDANDLYPIALSDAADDVILRAFLDAQLPDEYCDDFRTFVEAVRGPIAVRSSSLLEDSHYQPFAGIYSTYMIPYLEQDIPQTLRLLSKAIKGVYASVYYRNSKDYMTATRNVIDQEKMAVILQEVVGQRYGDRFYPTISGVLRSLNYYPIEPERAEEGVVSLAFGLGKYIVDGGQALRVCAYHPGHVMQMSEVDKALRETQTKFLALDMRAPEGEFSVDDGFNLLSLPVRQAVGDGSMQWICSTFDPYDQVIRDGFYDNGRKLISFAGVLQNGVFPLPRLLQLAQEHGAGEMRRPVEIEFAVNIYGRNHGTLYLLQIRPIFDAKQERGEDLRTIADDDCLLRSHRSLGHGIVDDVCDIVYVKTDGYNPGNNPAIALEIETINRRMLATKTPYILVGPGRWGSSDPWLGIPVKWPAISGARVIVEAGTQGYKVDASQGTHFFQNLTSFNVGYLTINDQPGEGVYHTGRLDALPAVEETAYVRHVRFPSPLTIKMDGMKSEAVVIEGR